MKYHIGDAESIPHGTEVLVELAPNTEKVKGIIVGKYGTDIVQSHIVKCTDGQFPHNGYHYDTFVVGLCFIETIE